MPDPVFATAPEEVVRYFEAKGVVPTYDWRDFAPQEHALSFTVAKTAGYDVLDDIRDATLDAIKNQQSFEVFRENLEPTLRKKGWWGKAIVDDPLKGKPDVVQLGSMRRLRTIYWANTATARAAGEWERTQRTKRGLPYLIYELSVAEKRRPEHLGWVGVILPVDHSFWATHYPPNGWLCKCRVRQISRKEAESLGYDVETPEPQIVYKSWKNKRTGEMTKVPTGIDPGWQNNPGATRASNLSSFLNDRIESLPEASRKVAISDLVGSKVFRAMQSGELPYRGAADRCIANIESGRIAFPVARLPEQLFELMPAKVHTVLLSNADAHKQLTKRLKKSGQSQLDEKDYALVQEIIESGLAFEDARFERDFIFQKMIDGKPWTVILRVTRDGKEIFLKSFRRVRPEQFGENDIRIPLE